MGRTKKKGVAAPEATAAAADDDGPSTSYDARLPDNLELARTRVVCGTDMNLHVSLSGRRTGAELGAGEQGNASRRGA